jgi:uncharacterized protein with von Willebrand factor type A (vWA) domain
MTPEEFSHARSLIRAIALERPHRRTHRLRPDRRGSALDVRALVRRSLATGGDPVHRTFRSRTAAPRKLVLLLDVSGSMEAYSRALLLYLHAARGSGRGVEAFAFGTRLTRITRELAGRDPDRALARATAAVVDLGGGTRMGEALAQLNREYGRRVGRGAVVVVLSDGWDRGDPEQLAEEMARLRRTAHRLVWLNPLAADPRYEPLTRGMQAALPHTDHLLPGNSLASLSALADLMETIT